MRRLLIVVALTLSGCAGVDWKALAEQAEAKVEAITGQRDYARRFATGCAKSHEEADIMLRSCRSGVRHL